MPIKIIDLKECEGNTEKIESFLNKTIDRLATYKAKSITLTDDRNTATVILGHADGMNYFNMLTDAADAKKNENLPASWGDSFKDAIGVLLNHTNGLVRMFIPEKISDGDSRWFEVFGIILPVNLGGNKKIQLEIISNYPHDVIQTIKEAHPGRVKVFIPSKAEKINSFMVVEPIGYWMEVLEKENMIRGFANFGDTEGTKKLIECFDKKLKPSTTPRF